MKKIVLAILALLVIGVLVVIIAGFMPERAPMLPAGCAQNQSTYVTMKDDTKIAVRISLPYGMQKNDKVPTIMETTRYGTKYKKSFILNALMNLGIAKEAESIFYETLLKSNYAVIRVDARGSGASFGRRDMEWSKEEIDDMNQIIEWVTKQWWSNGKVGTYGVSYSGNTAELAMISNNKALLASAPLYPDFNPMKQSALPGGIYNEVLIRKWSESNKAMDANETDLFNGGVAPVDNDKNEKMLNQAIAEHNTIDIYKAINNITFFDDNLTNDYKAESLSPYIYKQEIQKSEVPIHVRVGWHDAGTVNGAIERFLTYNNKQELIIGPWSHGGYHSFDPFMENASTEKEIFMQRRQLETMQAKEVISFFDICLKEDKNNNIESKIRYYTLGEGKWKTTKTWPVKGFNNKILYFDNDKKLSYNKPEKQDGSDTYKVDFTATTGQNNRWFTNIGGGVINYPNRAQEDSKLLTYTSKPLENNVEITGIPVVTLNVSSDTTDGAFYVYLENVAPDGTVTYITEGQLRAIHKKVTDKDLGYTPIGPKHSFHKNEGRSLTPGQNTELKIGMYATSVLIKKGHSIRIAIAGHDSANFKKVPSDNEDVTIEVQRNNILSSYVELPMKIRD
ncbi:CocE/NonD family hydrolase [Wukongibacter sp. M2B1]|uniref:CocE/NonD family hydrolase n=1 Tax=Wukongibacter sp. M2B1 TaxID=3088895 RepID=UPI003D7A7706